MTTGPDYDSASTEDEPGPKKRRSAKWWLKQYQIWEKEKESWEEQADDAYEEYTFCRTVGSKGQYRSNKATHQHLSLYWATIQTAKPSVYNQTPTPIITRTFQDPDPAGRVGGLLLDRMAKNMLRLTPYDTSLERITENYLIAGFAVGRVFYKGVFKSVPDPMNPEVMIDEVVYEEVTPVWIPYDAYAFTPGVRDESEVWWKAQEHFFDRDEFAERFAEKIAELGDDWSRTIPFSHSSRKTEERAGNYGEEETGEFCKVIEFWNLRDKLTCWVCYDWTDEYLDEKENIYDLRKFFPFTTPLRGTLGNENLQPVPDYVQYRQSLANLDFLQSRKRTLIRALRAKGVYDSSKTEIQRLCNEANEADLVPVDNFMELAEKGGLANVIQYVDTSSLAAALMQVYNSEEAEKQAIYEVTGFSDIMRGSSVASETATAQQLKSEYGSVRLKEKIKRVAACAREMIELMCDLALSRFSAATLIDITGAKFLSPEDQQLVPDAIALLKNDRFRTFQISIETDSTVAIQSQLEKDSRTELLNTFTGLIEQVGNIVQTAPSFLPAIKAVSLYAIRGMRQSAAVESAIEASFQALEEEAAQPPPEPPPDPGLQIQQMKAESDMQLASMKLQGQQTQGELKAALAQQKLNVEEAKLALQQQKIKSDMEIAALQAQQEKMQIQMDLVKSLMQVESQKSANAAQIMSSKGKEEKTPSLPSEITVKMLPSIKEITLPDGRKATSKTVN